jgi:hypothetical protein
MRFLVALLACAALIACGEDDEPAGSSLTELTVEVDPGGKRADVRCDTPEESELCREVSALDPKVFEPTPGNVACTQQYGGPETATVIGTFRGEPVDARFSRENGCEIARWQDAAPLLEAAQ